MILQRSDWIFWLASDEVLGVALVIIGILLLRGLFGKYVSQRLKYALWLVVLFRLMIPFSGLDWKISLATPIPDSMKVQRTWEEFAVRYREATARPNLTTSTVSSALKENMDTIKEERQEHTVVQPLEEMPSENGRVFPVTFPVKRVGRIVLAVFFLAANLWFYRNLRRERILMRKGLISIYRSELAGSPFVFGCSVYMTEASLKNKKYVLAHERTHIFHGDPLWNLLRCLCLALYWYHPLVWVAAILSQKDAELACDEGTIARLGQAERKSYARALLDILTETKKRNTMLCITQMNGSKREMKNRILMIANKRRHNVLLAMLVCILAFTVLTLTACQDSPSEDIVAGKNDGIMESLIREEKVTDPAGNTAARDGVTGSAQKLQDTFFGAEDTVNIRLDAEALSYSGAMPVLRVKPHEITSDEVKRIANILFEGNTVYDMVVTKSKSEIEEEILEVKQLLADEEKIWENASTQEDYDVIRSYWEEHLRILEESYPNAPDVVERKESSWQFHPLYYYDYEERQHPEAMDADAINYSKTVSLRVFGQMGNGTGTLWASNRSEDDYQLHNISFWTDSVSHASGDPQLTSEEAIAIAKDKIEQMGIGTWSLVSCSVSSLDDAICYDMCFTPVYEGVRVLPVGQLATIKGEADYAARYYYEELRVTVCGGKIVDFVWESPMDVIEVENADVRTMGLGDICERFKKQMQIEYTLSKAVHDEDTSEYIGAEILIDTVENGLARIKVKNRENEFYYVPAWGFYGDTGIDTGQGIYYFEEPLEEQSGQEYAGNFAVINALDGSIINVDLGY